MEDKQDTGELEKKFQEQIYVRDLPFSDLPSYIRSGNR
ncbi:MAG: hypothetical protein CM1200mP30_05930 [Pseudomonadota bacterium]|nr:MAG: hypothetical protein CM1200mP30_05930 [Pseudomonadota bacterium]